MDRGFGCITPGTGKNRKKKVDLKPVETKWDEIFDIFSSEYGWTTDQISKMTLREVNWRIDAINSRVDGKLRFDAALHGAKLGGENKTKKEYNFNEEQDEKLLSRLEATVKSRKK